jgi:hypothetical protein
MAPVIDVRGERLSATARNLARVAEGKLLATADLTQHARTPNRDLAAMASLRDRIAVSSLPSRRSMYPERLSTNRKEECSQKVIYRYDTQIYVKLILATDSSEAQTDRSLGEARSKQEPTTRDREIDLSRPTYIKVNRKYLLPDTLDHYKLPWEWDKVSGVMFAH